VTDEELLKLLGPTGLREYKNATENHQREAHGFITTMSALSDLEFVNACEGRILESARCNSWRGNWEGIHAMASACFTESKRRFEAAGHTEDCTGDSLYQKGYIRAYASQGHTPPERRACDCGADG
jgi:hypothetical protein